MLKEFDFLFLEVKREQHMNLTDKSDLNGIKSKNLV